METGGGTSPLLAWTRRVMDMGMSVMQLILSALRNTDRPIMVYVWYAWFIMLIPGIPIVLIVFALVGTRLPAETDTLFPYLTSTRYGVMLVKRGQVYS